MLARRRFLGVMAASPLVARKAAEETAAKLGGIALTPSGGDRVHPPTSGELDASQWRAVLKNPLARAEVVSHLYTRERHVGVIEPDLAIYRSFSLAAKIAYQRQRNVERELHILENEWPWQRLQRIGKTFLGLLPGLGS